MSREARAEACALQVGGVRAALPSLSAPAAEHLLLSVVALVTSWWSLPHLTPVILTDPAVAERRTALVAQAIAMARA